MVNNFQQRGLISARIDNLNEELTTLRSDVMANFAGNDLTQAATQLETAVLWLKQVETKLLALPDADLPE